METKTTSKQYYRFRDLFNERSKIIEDYTYNCYMIAVLAYHPFLRARIDNDYGEEGDTVLLVSKDRNSDYWEEFIGTVSLEQLSIAKEMVDNGDFICDDCSMLICNSFAYQQDDQYRKYCYDCYFECVRDA